MKKVVLAFSLIVAAHAAFGAVEYQFRQITSSDVENVPSGEFSGKGVIDGTRSRIDFLSGNAYTPGSYVITTNGSHNLVWVDPAKQAYVEVNAAGVATAVGAAKISVANKKVNLVQLEDHPQIAGLPTTHYRLTLSYDMTVSFGTIPVTQSISQIVDKWTTTAFESISENFLADGGVHTGNPDLDSLIDAETSRTQGFALKQTVSITTTSRNSEVAGSPLKVSRTRTVTREFTITSIEPKATVPASTFIVPASFHKADPLHDDSQTPPRNLSLVPSGE